MNAAEWLASVQSAHQELFSGAVLRYQVKRSTRVKVRIEIGADMFADLFFRQETGRTDYALIAAGKRIYGLDNLGGWHEHPLISPNQHIPVDAPSPEDALRCLRKAVDQLASEAR